MFDDLMYYDIYVNSNFKSHTQDCIGAIDGTHIPAKVSSDIVARFRGRYKQPTQNVLAVVRFDMRFSYVLAGWEGSANDCMVLHNALERPNGLRVPSGNLFSSIEIYCTLLARCWHAAGTLLAAGMLLTAGMLLARCCQPW